MKVYGADICGDCRAFDALMQERGFEVEHVDITASVLNMKEFLKLRDTDAAFAAAKERGSIGIPAFVNDNGECTLDVNTALAWIGQPPVEEEAPCCEGCK